MNVGDVKDVLMCCDVGRAMLVVVFVLGVLGRRGWPRDRHCTLLGV